MTLFRHPDRLVDLSLQALCKYVCNLLYNYFENPCSFNDACRHLEHILKHSLPQFLANKVTENLLATLDAKVIYIDKNLSKLFDIIMLPTVTKLDFCFDKLHRVPYWEFDHNWNKQIIREVLQRVNTLHDLKVLRIQHTLYGKYLFPSSLLEFTYYDYCDNKILEQLSECCKGLKKLDLHNSTSIEDSTIKFIVKFKFLEHIDLCGTSISEQYMTEILTNLATNKCEENASQLKSFGCNSLTSSQFEFLIHNFTQITCLEFSPNINCEFDLLRNLTFLKSFRIDDVSAKDLETILDTVGSQLIVLHFGCDEQFDLCKLAVKCTAVRCLHITSESRDILVPNVEEMKELPGLKLVKCLNVYFNCSPQAVACIISVCQDVEVLEVSSDSDEDLIADAILNNPMTSLRELNWRFSENFKFRIIQHCPNLEVMRGICVWKKHGNINNVIPFDYNIYGFVLKCDY